MRRTRRLLAGLALAGVAALDVDAAAGPEGRPVDLQLVLAVDVSYSMDAQEQEIQRDGYRAAIVSKPVLDAIAEGTLGRIAVAYVEWAGVADQRVIVPWTLIDGAESARAFADRLGAEPVRRSYRTSISGALAYAATLFDDGRFVGARRVIDVSGDGPNNQGETVEAARDEVLKEGVTVNGLPLMLKRPNLAMLDVGDLDAYYRDCVVGGPGAFMIPVRAIEQFPDAVRTKLLMEIAGLAPDRPEISSGGGPAAIPADDRRRRADCTAGEQLWRERFGD